MDLNEAIYLIRSKEKMIKADYRIGSGNTKEYLEGRIKEALQTTRKELNKQVKERVFTSETAKGIFEALSTMPKLVVLDSGEAVATFPEYRLNELHICSEAINLEN